MHTSEGAMMDVGLVLMDLSLRPIAFDQGAAAILKYPTQPGLAPAPASWIPKEILSIINSRLPTDVSSLNTHFRVGTKAYICRSYIVESHNGSFPQPIMALHLEKDPTASDTIDDIAAKYHLTKREQEVLTGVSSSGLTNKELASRMNISPNTVKLFLRLAMIKMGVTTRAGLVAKILHQRTNDDGPEIPEEAA